MLAWVADLRVFVRDGPVFVVLILLWLCVFPLLVLARVLSFVHWTVSPVFLFMLSLVAVGTTHDYFLAEEVARNLPLRTELRVAGGERAAVAAIDTVSYTVS